MVREKQIFLREKSGNCVLCQGNFKFYLKVSKKTKFYSCLNIVLEMSKGSNFYGYFAGWLNAQSD